MRLASCLTAACVAGLALIAGVSGCIPPSHGGPGAVNIVPRPPAPPPPPPVHVADETQPPEGPLPRDVRPVHYAISMSVVPARDRFSGSEQIAVELSKPRTVIWMHGRGLDVKSVELRTADGRRLSATWDPVSDAGADGLAAVRLPEPVGPGKATIALRWSAPFGKHLEGLYRVRTGGEAYAFTQFESVYARSAFPCFDDPAFKAPFDLTLEVSQQDVALSNTPVVETTPLAGDLKRVKFTTTKPLPTYLVAWAVGPLDVVDGGTIPTNAVRHRGVHLRGIAVRGEGGKLKKALAETPAILSALERYVGMSYPFTKLDIVAVPDFAAGAMENPGLLTFRDTFLLMGDDAPEWQKRAFAGVMAHELSHQWFGDLVTMPWWDEVWLNEAFATWLGARTVAEVYPQYHARLGLLGEVHYAMREDSLAAARAIRQPVESRGEIENAFDAITYEKGAAVLGMFDHWLGDGVFRRGLHAYLFKHAFGTATTEDLMAALSAASKKDVAPAFRTFLDQPGVPFLSATVSCSDEGTKLGLHQTRYLPAGSSAASGMSWKIPVCVRAGMGPGRVDGYCTLLADSEQDVLLQDEKCADWVMPNADAAGYYRFTLDPKAFDALRTQGWAALEPREKLAFADSMKAAFASGDLDVRTVFDALGTFAQSDVRPVAEAPMGLVQLARDRLVSRARRHRVERFGRRLYAPVWKRLGWEPKKDEPGEDRLLRAGVLRFLALVVEDPRIRAEALKRGERYLGWGDKRVIDPSAVSTDLVGTTLVVAVQDGDPDLFDYLLDETFQVADPLLRSRMLDAVAHATKPELAQRVLALTLDTRLHVNEVLTPLWVQMSMPETRDAAWKWLTEHYDAVVQRLSTPAEIPMLGSMFCSADAADQVQTFFASRVGSLAGGQHNLDQAVEAIRLCAAQVKAHHTEADKYF